jgi:hypothetical protein
VKIAAQHLSRCGNGQKHGQVASVVVVTYIDVLQVGGCREIQLKLKQTNLVYGQHAQTTSCVVNVHDGRDPHEDEWSDNADAFNKVPLLFPLPPRHNALPTIMFRRRRRIDRIVKLVFAPNVHDSGGEDLDPFRRRHGTIVHVADR